MHRRFLGIHVSRLRRMAPTHSALVRTLPRTLVKSLTEARLCQRVSRPVPGAHLRIARRRRRRRCRKLPVSTSTMPFYRHEVLKKPAISVAQHRTPRILSSSYSQVSAVSFQLKQWVRAFAHRAASSIFWIRRGLMRTSWKIEHGTREAGA